MEHAVRLDGLSGHVPPIRHTPIVGCGTKILERLTAGYEVSSISALSIRGVQGQTASCDSSEK